MWVIKPIRGAPATLPFFTAVTVARFQAAGGTTDPLPRIPAAPDNLQAQVTAADAITLADIGKDCFIVDDQTVAKTDGAGTRSRAGRVFDVDADGVWVDFR